jgi:hypothetical protein
MSTASMPNVSASDDSVPADELISEPMNESFNQTTNQPIDNQPAIDHAAAQPSAAELDQPSSDQMSSNHPSSSHASTEPNQSPAELEQCAPQPKQCSNELNQPVNERGAGRITRERLISALQAAAAELGHAPTTTEFARVTGIHDRSARRYFRTYLEAVRAAGLEPSPVGQRLNSARILEDWGRVVRKMGYVPTRREYLREGTHGYIVFRRRFQKWSMVPAAFYRFVTTGKLAGEWEDVLEKIRRGPIPATGFGKNLKRWREEAKQDMLAGDPVAATQEEQACEMGGSAKAAAPMDAPEILRPLRGKKCVTTTMLGVLYAGMSAISSLFPRRALADRPMLGAPTNIPGLAYAPVNEMGVVLLFGRVAEQLGFIVESVRAAFPDCEAKMEVEPGIWQHVRIEFEYESYGFKEHRHDPEKCDLIVCWRHNWKACPGGLQVLELSRLLQHYA